MREGGTEKDDQLLVSLLKDYSIMSNRCEVAWTQ